MIRNQDDYNTLTLQVPDEYRGEKSQWYSRRSKLIVLQGPRGPLVARYVRTDEPPDAGRTVKARISHVLGRSLALEAGGGGGWGSVRPKGRGLA